MRCLALLFAFLLPYSAQALSIEADESEALSYSEALKNCRDAGFDKECSRSLKAGDTVDGNAFDSCMSFQSEENDRNVGIDDDRPQVEIGARGFSRYGSCLKVVKNRAFNGKALSICSVMHDFLQQLECFEAVANKAFHNASADLCLKVAYSSTTKGLECLKVVEGRAYPAAKRKACEKAQDRLACLRSGQNDDFASCQERLSLVERQAEAFQARSTNREIKRGLQPILDAIRQRPDSQSAR